MPVLAPVMAPVKVEVPQRLGQAVLALSGVELQVHAEGDLMAWCNEATIKSRGQEMEVL